MEAQYARVPEEMKRSLIKDLKRMRRNSALLWFPVVLLIFSSLALLAVFGKGHGVVWILEDLLQKWISRDMLTTIILISTVIITAGFLEFFLSRSVRDSNCDEYYFCPKCVAVDSDENGRCPICAGAVTEKAFFIFTASKDEAALIKRKGLQIYSWKRNAREGER